MVDGRDGVKARSANDVRGRRHREVTRGLNDMSGVRWWIVKGVERGQWIREGGFGTGKGILTKISHLP